MNRIGYHGEVGALVIVGLNVYPPGTLSLIEAEDGYFEIWSLAQRAELRVLWSEVMSLDGLRFETHSDAGDYLRSEFRRRPPSGDAHTVPITVETAGQTTIPLNVPPTRFDSLRCEVNGVIYRPPDIAVSPVAVTWADPSFSLAPTDRVTVAYS